jgi:hypothetical protein
MRIFGLVIKKEREYDALERDISRMAERRNNLSKMNEALKARIKQYESGKRCTGGYCSRCVHDVPATSIYTRAADGCIVSYDTYLCDLDVPCPDFEPEEAKTNG